MVRLAGDVGTDGAGAGEARRDAPADGVVDGVVDGVGVGVGEADGVAGGLGRGAGAEGGGTGVRDTPGEGGAVGDVGPGALTLTSGTLSLTSWAIGSRDGGWYVNSPLANPAAATTAAPAPAADSRTVRRDRRRGGSPAAISAGGGDGRVRAPSDTGPVPAGLPPPGGAPLTTGIGKVSSAASERRPAASERRPATSERGSVTPE
ncbi:hypothetical protein GCM10010339_04920 [Streptomyces alanosinicus]|uniref:Uncharacterized protein n=1 Tax=Streptomyces alanosinicus TaxID=68171 RepID=A0A919CZW3_9ACTN|nr:hypothetical protein GCM10010339_04920 [Streptomyces alanosinicus]